MSDRPAIHRQLSIKSGAAKRLLKEHVLYAKEAEEQQRKVDKLIADNAEQWDTNSAYDLNADQRRILEESHRMMKDSDNRLGKAVQDLRELVLRVKSRTEFAEDIELLNAEGVLEEASVHLEVEGLGIERVF